jgi:putative radical SAM enzyme (TIGR03279 family)
MKKTVATVQPQSIAEQAGIRSGDEIVAVNGNASFDIIDYMLETASESFSLTVKRAEATKEIVIDNPDWEPIGIGFSSLTADEPKRCHNNCIFCFMNQLPPNMRETLYFKDDDYRLSFLCGNYITLTNLDETDLERIISYRLSPMNISLHTTNAELRASMMNQPKAKNIMHQLQTLADGNIDLNLQLVLCPGYNDGDALRETLSDVLTLVPSVNSLSCVPVGLTKFREGLPKLELFDMKSAADVIEIIDEFRAKAYECSVSHLFYASDEFYVLAKQPFPSDDYYENYSQYENGVGMARSFIDTIQASFNKTTVRNKGRYAASLITGVLGFPILQNAAEQIRKQFPQINLNVICIQNDFFGRTVTASGLVCGADIIRQLQAVQYKHNLILPSNMLKDDKDIFLDDVSIQELENELHVTCKIAAFGGENLFHTILTCKE